MFSYDNPKRVQYDMGVIDFGTTSDIVRLIPVPNLRSGRVSAVYLGAVTEDFAGSTSDGGVQVGDGTDPDKYYDTGLVLDEGVDVADLTHLLLADDGAKVDIEMGRSTISVTFVATQGTPTGIAEVFVEVEWF